MDNMQVMITNTVPVKSNTDRCYWAFWLQFIWVDDPTKAISFSGFKFFPETGKIAWPEEYKGLDSNGRKRSVDTARLTGPAYDWVQALARQTTFAWAENPGWHVERQSNSRERRTSSRLKPYPQDDTRLQSKAHSAGIHTAEQYAAWLTERGFEVPIQYLGGMQ
jgi:hypothetical protein